MNDLDRNSGNGTGSEKPFLDGKRWRNPYIDRLGEMPSYILGAREKNMSEDDKSLLLRKMDQFKRTIAELGAGSGNHLIEKAAQDPGSLYVGFEIRFKRVFRTAEKAAQKSITNLLIAKSDARSLPAFFGKGSLDGVYVNFPDPWDKRRWEKHRMFSPALMRHIHGLLKPGGFISYKTDHLQRFEQTAAELKDTGLFELCRFTRDLHKSEWVNGNVITEFESIFLSQSLPVGYLLCTARPA